MSAPLSRAQKRRQVEANRRADLYRSTRPPRRAPRPISVRKLEPWSIVAALFEHRDAARKA